MNLGIAGQAISRIGFDFAIILLTDDGAEIRIESELSIRSPSGDIHILDPEHSGGNASQVLSLLHGVVRRATADETTGELSLEFDDGSQLRVDPDDDYEAWTFAGRKGEKCVSLPGGGLGLWSFDR